MRTLAPALGVSLLTLSLTPLALAQVATASQTSSAGLYAVTLAASLKPLAAEKFAQKLPGRHVYQAVVTVRGQKIYFVRLGFFTTLADAEAAQERLKSLYPAAWSAEIPDAERSQAGALLEKAPTSAPIPDLAGPPPKTLYAINLATAPSSEQIQATPIPAAFQDYLAYVARASVDGQTVFQLNLGFFATEEKAEESRRKLAQRFPAANVIKIAADEPRKLMGPGVEIPGVPGELLAEPAPGPSPAVPQEVVKAPAPPSPPVAPAAPGEQKVPPTATEPLTDVDRQAQLLLEQGKAALASGDNERAIDFFNRLLNLPPTPYSQEAQEYIGLVRERNGEIDKAKIEYELYLKLYPDTEGAARVRQRLANLSPDLAPEATRAPKRAADEAPLKSVFGSISQTYYRGASRVDTTTVTTTTDPSGANPRSTVDKATLSAVDQSALITNVDLSGRYRSADVDNRFVVRYTDTHNFLPDSPDRGRLSSAYLDHKSRPGDYSLRVGRQPASSNGVLSRFDGASGILGLNPQWRLNATAGRLAELTTGDTPEKTVFAGGIDFGIFNERWSGSAYYSGQQVEGIADRRAVGGELRYFGGLTSVYSLVDYDTLYKTFNIVLVQGNWQNEKGLTANFVIDHRKAPSIQTSNALFGETTTSVRKLLETRSEAEVRDLARARTATANLISAGLTLPVHTKWQLGGDIRVSNVSGLPASGTLPATAGTGTEVTYTVQAIGSSILSKGDVTVTQYSLLDAPSFKAHSVLVSNRAIFRERWTMDASLRLFRQNGLSGPQRRTTPGLRITYQAKERLAFEFELGIEDASIGGTSSQEKSRRHFMSLGYRWDF